jgi:hypothetical protein
MELYKKAKEKIKASLHKKDNKNGGSQGNGQHSEGGQSSQSNADAAFMNRGTGPVMSGNKLKKMEEERRRREAEGNG